jgi:hypothetical protein
MPTTLAIVRPSRAWSFFGNFSRCSSESSVVFSFTTQSEGIPPVRPSDDGRLHTLGLLEHLRAEARAAEGGYSDLYDRVDGLLRELANPNLHDIANMSFRVELWDRHAQHVRGASRQPAQSLKPRSIQQ